MFRRFFGGEKRGVEVQENSNDLEPEDIHGQIINGDSPAYKKSETISDPLLEGVKIKMSQMGFSVGDQVEIEYNGKKRVGKVGAALISPTPLLRSPLSEANPGVRIEFDSTNEWENIDLDKIESGEVKLKKIS